MKGAIAVLSVVCGFLIYKVISLDSEIAQLQRNAAIAVLSAEAANNKIGAIAPYFKEDKEAFMKAWLDSTNLPLAVFPGEILDPLRDALAKKRNSSDAQQLKADIFK